MLCIALFAVPIPRERDRGRQFAVVCAGDVESKLAEIKA
jgi:hypothetical protein